MQMEQLCKYNTKLFGSAVTLEEWEVMITHCGEELPMVAVWQTPFFRGSANSENKKVHMKECKSVHWVPGDKSEEKKL